MTDTAPARVVATVATAVDTLARPRFAALPPLALYVHIPWCISKCPYCDFNSHEARGDVARGALCRRVACRPRIRACRRSGGARWSRSSSAAGRPASFQRQSIDRAAGGRSARGCSLLPGAEVTLEANPGTFERQKFADFFARRRQSPVARHPELRSRAAACAGPRARRRRSAARGRSRADDLRQRQLRPHVLRSRGRRVAAGARRSCRRRSRLRRRTSRSIT